MSEINFEDEEKKATEQFRKIKSKIADRRGRSRFFKTLNNKELVEAQELPTIEQRQDIVKLIKYNGLVLVLDYGEYLLSLIHPWLGKSFGWSIKKLFNWKSKGF